MDDIPREVCQFFFVHTGRVAQHIPLLRSEQDVLIHRMVHPVDGGLALLHHINVSEARRAVLLHEQRVEHERILAVVIESAPGQRRVVLAGVEHHPVAELAVVQQHPALGVRLFVVPIHHDALFGGVQPAVVEEPGHIQHTGAVALELGPAGLQLSGVLHPQREKVRRCLDILHARLPVEHEQIHGPDGDLAQAAVRFRVPEDALDAGALLELAPPGVAVHLLVIGLFQHHRQDAGKHPRSLFVVCRAGQHVRGRVVVHRIGVFVGDGVEQPPAGRLGLALHHRILIIFPVPHPEPQFVVHQPFVERRLACLVLLQNSRRLGDLFRPDGQFFTFKFHSFSFPDPLSYLFARGSPTRGAGIAKR